MSKKFVRREKDKHTLAEKEELGNLCKRFKKEYDAKSEKNKDKANWSERVRKRTKMLPKEGYLAHAVRTYYPDL